MPNPNYSDPAIYQWMQDVNQRLRALEWQQNSGIRDPQGNIRVKEGLQSDGTYGLWIFDDSGNVVVKLGDQRGGATEGPYALAVKNPSGQMQLVSGRAISSVGGPLTYSTNGWGALPSGPSVTVVAGPNGAVDLALSAIIQPGSNPAGETAELAVGINGSTSPTAPSLECEVGASSLQLLTCSAEAEILGLTPDTSYTFDVLAWVSTGGTPANFWNVTIVASPV
jgi:hypothetical protein